MTKKTLRPYQQECLDVLVGRMKETTHPLLVNASVGAGKSLIIAELLLIMERAGYPSLCLTLNSTLIQQNADTYKLQNGNPGIYCAGLKSKDTENLVIFASPNSVCQDIKSEGRVSQRPFKLIVIDECHNISPHDNDSMYMRILNHYGFLAQQDQYSFRIVGLTGTPYRGKNVSIVGDDQLFKEEVCSITTPWLINQGYLTKPSFGSIESSSIDFSHCKVSSSGNFNTAELNKVVSQNERLTGSIMRELIQVIEGGRNGAFIFAASKKHCEECANSLPDGQWAIVTGDTPHAQRKEILEAAKQGVIKYLINVNVLTVGVDLPIFDVAAWLRPTESLVLYTQGVGRVLRLHEGKTSAIVLDYAGNLERHGDIDNPIINEALKQKDPNDPDYCIMCYTCNTLNTVHSRRCIGIVDEKRCEYYFEFKACPQCDEQNDITARECRSCRYELIDPNTKLSKLNDKHTLNVIKAEYWVTPQGHIGYPLIQAKYICREGDAFEAHFTNSEKSQNIAYSKFIKMHVENPSDYYRQMHSLHWMKHMIQETTMKTPTQLVCKLDQYNRFSIVKKIFNDA